VARQLRQASLNLSSSQLPTHSPVATKVHAFSGCDVRTAPLGADSSSRLCLPSLRPHRMRAAAAWAAALIAPIFGIQVIRVHVETLIPSTSCGDNLPTRAAVLSGPCRSIPERSSVNDDACTLRASHFASAAPLGLPAEAGSPTYRFTHHTSLVRRDYSRLAGPLEFDPLDPCRFSPSGRSSPTFSP